MNHLSKTQLIELARTSPALKWQSDRSDRFAYPANFRGRVPLKVKVAKDVLPDFVPGMNHPDESIICEKDNTYFVKVNSYGAVTALLPNGKQLGLLPQEFDVVEWHS